MSNKLIKSWVNIPAPDKISSIISDVLNAGIGLLKVPFYKKIAKAEGEALLTKKKYEHAEKELDNLFTKRDRRYLKTIEHVLAYAIDDLSVMDEEEIQCNVNEDWCAFFFDQIQYISDDDVCFIWGKILAGEIKKEGSFSKRTLNVLAMLSTKEANVFKNITRFVINNTFIPNNFEYIYPDFAGNLKLLFDAGLLTQAPLGYSLDTKGESEFSINMGNREFEFIAEKPLKCNLKGFFLSESGEQLMNITQTDPTAYDVNMLVELLNNYTKIKLK